MDVMFVQAHVALPLSLRAARDGLDDVLHADGLGHQSSGAYADGLALLLRVGPRGAASTLSKQVLVHLLDPRPVGNSVVVPLRWEATGPSGRLFPALDANLGLTPAADDSTLLSIVGRYEPPFGGIGERLDHAVLAKVAEATARSLVQRMSALIVDAAKAHKDSAPVAAHAS
jgi:hypothetical protein